ncbi:radical SAM protein [Catellatospora tritici]|uniref:radical SAM protein n=1 Tax=Catellatospora tritici TaxID=2851566 RepID=UPI001C2DE6E8|nr:radical SAM protein [Catellatospora tritici]MBV1850643.1 radical SAM protein [Catellatospora tritici]
MHLAEVIRLRTVPQAGLLLALTQRCPLSCAHCSTDSSPTAPQHSAAPLRRLVSTFTAAAHPELIFMSGGEPLLRPDLVAELATAARTVGTRSMLLSGMFFARRSMPAAVRRAVSTLDHFSASIDVFHEREVARSDALRALAAVADLVPSVSLHVTSSDEAYLTDVLTQVRRMFGDRVPVLVARVRPTGRARSFVADPADVVDPGPCEFANWPLVDFDGTVYACSRQNLVRRHRPGHLVLGHAARDSWSALSAAIQARPTLRSVRSLGAIETARRAGAASCDGVCQTCVGLPGDVAVPEPVEQVSRQLLGSLRPRQLARRWGAGEHSDLVELGWVPCAG